MENTQLDTGKNDAWLNAKRGLLGRCPHCGKGKLFARYLKQVERCTECNEHYGDIRADDGPAWLTIMVVGHILAPLLLIDWLYVNFSEWQLMAIIPALALVLTLSLLPRAKGLFIAILWRGQHKPA